MVMAVLRTGEGYAAAPKTIGTELPCPLVIVGTLPTVQPADPMEIWSNSGTLTVGTGGGGGGGSLATLTDVDFGELSEPAVGDILYGASGGGEDPLIFTNIPLSTLTAGATSSYLGALPGFAANQILSVNAAGDGFEWIAPA